MQYKLSSKKEEGGVRERGKKGEGKEKRKDLIYLNPLYDNNVFVSCMFIFLFLNYCLILNISIKYCCSNFINEKWFRVS